MRASDESGDELRGGGAEPEPYAGDGPTERSADAGLHRGSDASATALRRIDLEGADLRYAEHAYTPAQADALLAALHAEIPWQRHRLKLFGREVDAPRLSCWIGDADAVYTYSRARFTPQPWTPALAAIRDDLAARYDLRFNSVLANLYRDGRDAMGWHSDDEPELGPEPVIASLSFGAVRTFRLRARTTRAAALSLQLGHGSVLVMAGATQRLYQHALPRRAGVAGARINLTFRRVRGDFRDVARHRVDDSQRPSRRSGVVP